MIIKKILVSVLALGILCNCNNDTNILAEEEITVCKEVNYGDSEFQKMDISYTYPLSKKPIIFYVHGGGWVIGDKKELNDEICKFFISKGFICVSVNYPLSPYPFNFEKDKVRHPKQIISISKAFNWVEENIYKYGGDPNNINVMGHSAGGQLAALLTFESKYFELKNKDCIRNAIILDGGSYLIGCKSLIDKNLSHKQMIENAIGTNTNYEASDFFPINNGTSINQVINYILIHSSDEYRDQSNKYFIKILEERCYKHQEYILEDYSHVDVLNKIPLYWPVLGIELLEINR